MLPITLHPNHLKRHSPLESDSRLFPLTRACSQLGKPNDCCGQGQESMKVLSQFFIAGRQTTKLFQPLKETFNVRSSSIQIAVIAPVDETRDFGRNDRLGPTLLHSIQDGLGIISFIGQYRPNPTQLGQQRWPLRHIGRLPPSQQKSHRIAQRINQGVNLGGQAPS